MRLDINMRRTLAVAIMCLFWTHSTAQQGVPDLASAEYIMLKAFEKATADWETLRTQFQYTVSVTTDNLYEKDPAKKKRTTISPPGTVLKKEETVIRVQDVFQTGRHLYERDLLHNDQETYKIKFQPAMKEVPPLPDSHFGKYGKQINDVLSKISGSVIVRRSDFTIINTNDGKTVGPLQYALGVVQLKEAIFDLKQEPIGEYLGRSIWVPTKTIVTFQIEVLWPLPDHYEIKTIVLRDFRHRAP